MNRSLQENVNVEFQIRPATPEDALLAVPLIFSSGPAAFDVVFADDRNSSAQEFLQSAFRQPGGEFGYTNHTVVTHQGQVIGIGACFSAKSSLAFMVAVIPQIIRFYGILRGIRVIRKGLKAEQLFQLPSANKNYFAHLAIAPEWRGHGIGSQLLRHFLDRSRAEGQTHAVLDVSVQNPRAEALYQRLGFKTLEERTTSLPGIAKHWRMEIEL
jgi:ribosomal protein S18 acetylase RimI-like enzyme